MRTPESNWLLVAVDSGYNEVLCYYDERGIWIDTSFKKLDFIPISWEYIDSIFRKERLPIPKSLNMNIIIEIEHDVFEILNPSKNQKAYLNWSYIGLTYHLHSLQTAIEEVRNEGK
jgi:hypothetical protein